MKALEAVEPLLPLRNPLAFLQAQMNRTDIAGKDVFWKLGGLGSWPVPSTRHGGDGCTEAVFGVLYKPAATCLVQQHRNNVNLRSFNLYLKLIIFL